MVTRLMVPRAHAYLVTSFFDAKVTKPNTFLFPPILRDCILKAKTRQGEHVLVYVSSARRPTASPSPARAMSHRPGRALPAGSSLSECSPAESAETETYWAW